MLVDVFDEKIGEIDYLLKQAQRKLLILEERKRRNQNYTPSQEYFRVREFYEEVRTMKPRLIRRSNRIMSFS